MLSALDTGCRDEPEVAKGVCCCGCCVFMVVALRDVEAADVGAAVAAAGVAVAGTMLVSLLTSLGGPDGGA
ncbi:hypothetical protein PENTCL1PPCAC_698, partial [Pristionchus entomophagus]